MDHPDLKALANIKVDSLEQVSFVKAMVTEWACRRAWMNQVDTLQQQSRPPMSVASESVGRRPKAQRSSEVGHAGGGAKCRGTSATRSARSSTGDDLGDYDGGGDSMPSFSTPPTKRPLTRSPARQSSPSPRRVADAVASGDKKGSVAAASAPEGAQPSLGSEVPRLHSDEEVIPKTPVGDKECEKMCKKAFTLSAAIFAQTAWGGALKGKEKALHNFGERIDRPQFPEHSGTCAA